MLGLFIIMFVVVSALSFIIKVSADTYVICLAILLAALLISTTIKIKNP